MGIHEDSNFLLFLALHRIEEFSEEYFVRSFKMGMDEWAQVPKWLLHWVCLKLSRLSRLGLCPLKAWRAAIYTSCINESPAYITHNKSLSLLRDLILCKSIYLSLRISVRVWKRTCKWKGVKGVDTWVSTIWCPCDSTFLTYTIWPVHYWRMIQHLCVTSANSLSRSPGLWWWWDCYKVHSHTQHSLTIWIRENPQWWKKGTSSMDKYKLRSVTRCSVTRSSAMLCSAMGCDVMGCDGMGWYGVVWGGVGSR